MSVVAMGTSGYGSTGTILASTITDSTGNFSFGPGAYTCPQSDTPVYLMGVGGNPGAGENPSVVLAAGLGKCAGAASSYTIVNEVTTAGLAFTLSHFFSTTLGGANGANDWFGGPSTRSGGTVQYSKGLVMGNNFTIPTIVFNAIGAANQTGTSASGTVYIVEWQKINTIANILWACVNTTGAEDTSETRTTCGKLFDWTANGATTRPSDTLQAAVQMALHPLSGVIDLFNLTEAQSPFFQLSAAPNDWTIGVSYTTSALGLGVGTFTLSTLDIDSDGRAWFPSNAAGQAGAAYFDPASMSFNGPFNTTALVHPQQVAIDANGEAWFNDSARSTLGAYLVAAPTTTQAFAMGNAVSDSLTVGADDRINVGITNASGHGLGNVSADRTSFELVSGVSFADRVSSMAGDVSNGDAVTTTNPGSGMESLYVSSAPDVTTIVTSSGANSGQVIYTGDDYISVRTFVGIGRANGKDGICIYSTSKCYNIGSGSNNEIQGAAIDGSQNLWIAESGNGGILQIPVTNPLGTRGTRYLDPGTLSKVTGDEFLHGPGNGGTAPTPYGIGVDGTGNVWVTNAGCNSTNCAPGSFTLTEIVGAATPTITPVSAQITSGITLVGTQPTN
jgi:streptogramin lyase